MQGSIPALTKIIRCQTILSGSLPSNNHIDLWNPLELKESLVDICKLSLELIFLQNDRNQYIHELVLEPEDSGDLARLKHIVNRVLESIAQVQSLQFE